VEAPEPATYQWLLHARSEMTLDEGQQTVRISSDDARLHTQLLQPTDLSFEQVKGFPVEPERGGSDHFHFTADTVDPAESAVFHSVLTAYRAGDSGRVPEAEVLEAEGGAAVRLQWPDESALVLWRLGDADEVSYGDHATQADVVVIRRNAEGETVGMYSCGASEVNDA
jgi:hypothetical protein